MKYRAQGRAVCSALTAFPRVWCIALMLGVGTLVLVILAGCGPKPAVIPAVQVGFLGNEACAGCHAQEFKWHHASRHDVTMRPVDKASIGAFWPAPGAIQGTDLVLVKSGDGVAMGWKGREAEAAPMDYALGSDRFAFTYIHFVNKHSLLELKQSYFPQTHNWLSTPGQAFVAGDALGRTYNEDISRHCLGCHTTTLPADDIKPEPRFFGVGCESCHGPGQKHVAAVQAGARTDLHMEKLGTWSATKLNTLCGRCHRTAENVAPDQANMTQRFEPYGLMKSRCFLETGDSLSCVTCHNPHTNASSDRKAYEKVCLGCHVPQTGFGPVESKGKACPVNPRSGCIPCHMPQRNVTGDAPFSMSDHYIRVFQPEDK